MNLATRFMEIKWFSPALLLPWSVGHNLLYSFMCIVEMEGMKEEWFVKVCFLL
jgi:hypothetical protein